jgi:hypothetical protein
MADPVDNDSSSSESDDDDDDYNVTNIGIQAPTNELVNSADQVARLARTIESLEQRIVLLGKRLETCKTELKAERKCRKEADKRAAEIARLLHASDAGAQVDEDGTVGFPKYESRDWGPGGQVQYDLCQTAAIRTKHFAQALPLFVTPRPCVFSTKFEDHMVEGFYLFALHRLVRELPKCPTCGRKMRCLGINNKGPRKLFTLTGPCWVLAYRYGCYETVAGVVSGKNAHVFLSYSGEMLDACPEVRRILPIYEMSKLMITESLLDCIHMMYTTTAVTLSQIQKTFASIYSSEYLRHVSSYLTAVGFANRPGTLKAHWGSGAIPPIELQHHHQHYDFFSVDTLRALVVWRSARLAPMQDQAMTMKLGTIVSGDHVFSGLRLTIIAGHRCFKGMYTLHNELNQCVLCVWVTDESYEALRNAFSALRKRFIAAGVIGVRIVYVDKCCGRGGFKDQLISKLKFSTAEKQLLQAKWQQVKSASEVSRLVALLDEEIEVKLDLAHSNGRVRKLLSFQDKAQVSFFEDFRQAHWLLQAPHVGKRWSEVPQNYRSIPGPMVLHQQLEEVLTKFNGHSFVRGETFVKQWNLLMSHVANGCLSDCVNIDLALATSSGQTRTARSSSQNEGGHRKIKGASSKGAICGTDLTAGSHRAIYWRHNQQQQERFMGGKHHPCCDIELLFGVRRLFALAFANLTIVQNPWGDCDLPPPQGGPADPLFDAYVHTTVVPTTESEVCSDDVKEACAPLCLPLKLYVAQQPNRPRCGLGILPSPPGKFFAQHSFLVTESTSLLQALFNSILPALASDDDHEVEDLTLDGLRTALVDAAKIHFSATPTSEIVGCLDTCSAMTPVLPSAIVPCLMAVAYLTGLAVCVVSGEAYGLVFIHPGGSIRGALFLELRGVANFASLIPAPIKDSDEALAAEKAPGNAAETHLPGTIRLGHHKQANAVGLQEKGHIVLTAPRTGKGDKTPVEKWSTAEDDKLKELVAKHTGTNGRHPWSLILRDWQVAVNEDNSVIKNYTYQQMSSHWQRLGKAVAEQPVAGQIPADKQIADDVQIPANIEIPADKQIADDIQIPDTEIPAETQIVTQATSVKTAKQLPSRKSTRRKVNEDEEDEADPKPARKKKNRDKSLEALEVAAAIAKVDREVQLQNEKDTKAEHARLAANAESTAPFAILMLCDQIQIGKEESKMLSPELLDVLLSFLFPPHTRKDVCSILPCIFGGLPSPTFDRSGTVLCPVLFKRHFVLVRLNGNSVDLYDSLRDYFQEEFEEYIKAALSIGKATKVQRTIGAGVQSEMSNDCAFFVCLNIQILLQKVVIEVPKKGKSVDRCVILEKLRLHLIRQ